MERQGATFLLQTLAVVHDDQILEEEHFYSSHCRRRRCRCPSQNHNSRDPGSLVSISKLMGVKAQDVICESPSERFASAQTLNLRIRRPKR